ncbi:prephenate dehydratase [Intrasporangium chromatireducens Q5-1]|uniref:Prephenate dehydratase n=1 Tax=Intrasporangium chromatireducens Q5-1 TaxID=584657 RepID=W9GMJ7_9MICO|nr:prephenate dehydratase [Intrasporangium chromatireducens]EWT06023.1 prephenate dehydratase [Intrasporangium chromatireducens Q5-1]
MTPRTPDELTRIAYLGPRGTFCEMALNSWAGERPVERVPQPSVPAALGALRAGEVDAAMVPIENSVEGGVSATLDALASGDPLVIIGEVLVPITFVLCAKDGMPLSSVRAVGTHSHAWAQVRGWMAANLPDAVYVPTLSTAGAAEDLAGGGDAVYDAAVCAPVAATNSGLSVIASDIGDNKTAVTRFALVTRPGTLPEPTGADKTTVVLYQQTDRAGGLLELLEQFAVRGVNMTRLESRPTGEAMGSYCFSIDFEGHVRDARVGETLMGLRRVCADVRFLGSYPRADGAAAEAREGTTDRDFAAAQAWLDALRA